MKILLQNTPARICLLSILAIVLSYLYLHNDNFTNQFLALGVAKPIYWGTQWLPFFFFALIFIPNWLFCSWWRFIRLICIPFLILIAISHELPHMYDPDRTTVTTLSVHVLVIISGIYIALVWLWRVLKNYRARKNR